MLSSLLDLQIWNFTTCFQQRIKIDKTSRDKTVNVGLIYRKKVTLFKIILHKHSDVADIIIALLQG
jgi:hypothetical protein